jgi:phenylacetic acid degradation operon negative regulatory protein
MTPDAFDQTKTALLALGGQRVWSLMVTLFGDLAQQEDSGIEGPVLSAIMAQMDVRPEAVRVALHRLRNDGWIASQKSGRTRRHALTTTSRRETLAASARIYASPTAEGGGWQLVLLEDAGSVPRDRMVGRGFTPLLPRVYLGDASAIPPVAALALTGAQPPDWLRTQIAAQMLEDEYTALLPILTQAERTLGETKLDPRDTAVLRCLIVHNWRRIVLRHPPLPPGLLPPEWAGHLCHLAVDHLLTRFPRPPLARIWPS